MTRLFITPSGKITPDPRAAALEAAGDDISRTTRLVVAALRAEVMAQSVTLPKALEVRG